MELWVEDSNWRDFGSQQGRDDWEFYLEKFGQYFSRGVSVDWDSGPLKDLSSYRHSNSHFRIKKVLDADEWQYMMQILARIDVSQIEHMELELPQAPAETPLRSRLEVKALGMDHLGPVLGSGRFSRLKTLRIGLTLALRKPDTLIRYLGSKGSAHLAEALEFGRFTNLRTLSLPACTVGAILGALKAGNIYDLRSFSIRSAGRSLAIKSYSVLGKKAYRGRDLSQNLGAVLQSGCLKRLQHLDLSRGKDGSSDNFLSDSDCWKVFLRAIKSGKLPNLTSLRLSENRGAKLADLVPFLLSTPLENLIMDGCEINSIEVERFADAIMKAARSPLVLKRLDLHNNELDYRGFAALVRLVRSEKLAQLQDLDLSMIRGLDSSALMILMETIRSGHHPSLKLLIWSRNRLTYAAEAFVRLHDGNGAMLPDEWYQVLYRQHVTNYSTGRPEANVTHYSVKRIEVDDMKGHLVDRNQDLLHYQRGTGYGAGSRMDCFGTILESRGCSTVEALELRITSEKSYDPEGLRQGPEGWAHLAGLPVEELELRITSEKSYDPEGLRQGPEGWAHLAQWLMTGQFTSLLTRSFPAVGVSVLTLECDVLTLECDVSAILAAWNENHMSHLRAFSITSMEGLDDLSRSSLHQRLDAALKDGCFKSLQHLDLSNGVLDGVDGWEIFTRAINSGNLPNIKSLRLSQNTLIRINLEDLVPLLLSKSFVKLVLDGCWINSEQIWRFADALLTGPGTGLALKWLDLHDNQLGNRAVDALVNLVESDFLPDLQILKSRNEQGNRFHSFRKVDGDHSKGPSSQLEDSNLGRKFST